MVAGEQRVHSCLEHERAGHRIGTQRSSVIATQQQQQRAEQRAGEQGSDAPEGGQVGVTRRALVISTSSIGASL